MNSHLLRKLFLGVICIFFIIYNNWNNAIFFSSKYINFMEKINILVSSPRIIILISNSIILGILLLFMHDKNKRKNILLFGLLVFQYFGSFFLNATNFWVVRCLIIAGIIFYLLKLFDQFNRLTRVPAYFKRFAYYITTLVFVFFIAEAISMHLRMPSFNGQAYVTRNWFKSYYELNSNRYRGQEFIFNRDKKDLIVLGDSFVEGAGIEDIDDRFSNVLHNQLKKEYNIYNLGVSGADSKSEYDSLQKFGIQPDILILAYYGNDIEYLNVDIPHETFNVINRNKFFTDLTLNSYFLNFLSIYFMTNHISDGYLLALKYRYANSEIYSKHLKELKKFISFCDENNTRLIVLNIPFVNNIASSGFYTNRINKFFKSNNIEIVDLGVIIEDEPTSQMIVNKFDSHLSEKGHKIVADELFRVITQGDSY